MYRPAQRTPGNFKNHLRRIWQWTVQCAAACMLMAASAEPFGNAGHVHIALAPKREPHPMIAQFPQEDRHIHTGDGNRIVDQAFTVLFCGSGPAFDA